MTRTIRRSPLSRSALLLAAILLPLGCSSMPWSDSPQQNLQPADFSASSASHANKPAKATDHAAQPVDPEHASPVASTDSADPTTAAPAEPVISPELKTELDRLKPPVITSAPPSNKDEKSFTVDAMIGQVNGRPIYASQVLEPLQAQFTAMGQQMTQGEFRRAAGRLLSERLYQIVFDALFLAEAERRMNDQEKFQLKIIMHRNREELIRKFGAGSEPAADAELRKTRGQGLDDVLAGIRQGILVRRYQESVIYPKIAVSKRDVERYYNRPEIYEKYNPKPGRKVRLMMVTKLASETSLAGVEKRADQIDEMLAGGMPFEKVAANPLNKYKPSSAGKYTVVEVNKITLEEKEIEILQGENLFGPAPLNEAMAKLKPGEHSPRIKVGDQYFWVYLEEVIAPTRKTLPEVQLELELQIRALQYSMIEQRYRRKLFEEAGFIIDGSAANPMEDMAASLVNIATGLYTRK